MQRVFSAVLPGAKESSSSSDDPVDMLKAQLQDFTQRLADGKEGGGGPGGKHLDDATSNGRVNRFHLTLPTVVCRDVGAAVQDLSHAESHFSRWP